VSGSIFADDSLDDRVELTLTIDGAHWGFAVRDYLNRDERLLMLRYKVDDTWSTQYRYVTKDSGGKVEHRFRIQHKTYKSGGWFLNTRLEHRAKQPGQDILRIRPQMGYKYSTDSPVTLFYKFEPHWELRYSDSEIAYKFAQHFFGFDFKVQDNFSISPFIELDTDNSWEKDVLFLGMEVSAKIP
jgi:hypothetical protein